MNAAASRRKERAGLRLNAARDARRDLAIRAALDAYAAGDAAAFDARLYELVDLNDRLFAEELAELGYLPLTIDGCVAVLQAAARVVEFLRGTEESLAA